MNNDHSDVRKEQSVELISAATFSTSFQDIMLFYLISTKFEQTGAQKRMF
jgi:hypothetical protein